MERKSGKKKGGTSCIYEHHGSVFQDITVAAKWCLLISESVHRDPLCRMHLAENLQYMFYFEF